MFNLQICCVSYSFRVNAFRTQPNPLDTRKCSQVWKKWRTSMLCPVATAQTYTNLHNEHINFKWEGAPYLLPLQVCKDYCATFINIQNLLTWQWATYSKLYYCSRFVTRGWYRTQNTCVKLKQVVLIDFPTAMHHPYLWNTISDGCNMLQNCPLAMQMYTFM